MEQRTLCTRCREDYLRADYSVERDYTVKDRESCDKCGRMGWTYFIEKTAKERKHDRVRR